MKKKIQQTVLSLLLFALVFTAGIALLRAPARAENLSGRSNDYRWTLTDSGTLYISGTGRYGGLSDQYYWTHVRKVVIDEGITEIGDRAFRYYEALTDITIPGSVKTIGEYAFQNCIGLTHVTVPYGVEHIARGAFCLCANLKSVTLPDSITAIENSVFSGCVSLTDCRIPGSVTVIGEYAFYNCRLLPSVSIPLSVSTIKSDAFYGCSSLRAVVIPKNVSKIGCRAFGDCAVLDSLSVAAGNSVYHSANNCIIETAKKTLAVGCRTGVIPADGSVTAIGSEAFRDCAGLTSVSIPDCVTAIGGHAFSGSGLESVVIPDSVTLLGHYSVFRNCRGLKRVTLPNGIKEIPMYCFENCSSLAEIDIPASVTYVGFNAFNGCTSLKKMTVASGNPAYHSAGNCIIKTNDKELVAGCGASVIPDDGSVTSIGYEAFQNCGSLTALTVPAGVTTIGDNAFEGCSALKSVVLADSVTWIGSYAFRDCVSLSSLTLPGTWMQKLGDYAFENCRSLTGVTVPDGVMDFGNAFKGCTGMTSAVFLSKNVSFPDDAFERETVIYGYAGTDVEWCANRYGNPFVPLDGPYLTLTVPIVVNDPVVNVCGFATPGAEVQIFVNDEKAVAADANATGNYYAHVPLAGALSGNVFTIRAEVSVNGKTAEQTRQVTCRPDEILTRDFDMTYGEYAVHITEMTPEVSYRPVRISSGVPFSFRVRVSNSEQVRDLFVVSTKNGESKKLKLTFHPASGTWLGTGFFDNDSRYAPGTLTVEGVDVSGRAFSTGFSLDIIFLIDPSGFVYEAVESNVLSDVTAVICYRDADGRRVLWNAEPAGQLNPVTTLSDGAFAWDVPEGQWQVRLYKNGYEDAQSEWMDVPPEHTNVYIPMVRIADPQVAELTVDKNEALIAFDCYMDIDSVTGGAVRFDGYTGTLVPTDRTETAQGSGVFYAKTFRFTPDKAFSDTVSVTAAGAVSYAGKKMQAFAAAVELASQPKNLTVSQDVVCLFGKTAEIGISAENAAGKTVTVSGNGAALTLSETSVKLDGSGRATLTVSAQMAGSQTLTFRLEGTSLTAQTTVEVDTVTAAPAYTPGDVNGDGSIGADDARLALRRSVDLENYPEDSAEFLACDVNLDGAVGADDARLILRASVDLEDPSAWKK